MFDKDRGLKYKAEEMREVIKGQLKPIFPDGYFSKFFERSKTFRLLKPEERPNGSLWGVLVGHENNESAQFVFFGDKLDVGLIPSRSLSRPPVGFSWIKNGEEFVREGDTKVKMEFSNHFGPDDIEMNVPKEIDASVIENFNPLSVLARREVV